MGFFQNLFGDAAADNISFEITENIKGLLYSSPHPPVVQF